MKSWKTTLTGIVIIGGILVSNYFPDHAEVVREITVALAGLGFILSRDNDVSSEEAGAK